jgi:hypothetical protein
MIHLGFDMGIRNLAYCLIEHKEEKWTVLNWDNIDLLENGQSSQTSIHCACGGKAKYISQDGKKWCNGCATGKRRKKTATEKPSFPILPCGKDVKALREHAISLGLPGKKMKKDELLTALASRYLMPWTPTKAADASLTDIRKAMDSWLNTMLPTIARSSLIRLENQPVLKGPTMKSVQIILFTLLGHRLEREHGWAGRIEFVHAGTKSRSAAPLPTTVPSAQETDGAAYRARKKTAESDVLEHLTKSGSSWLPFFQGRTKKSDLADAFLMALRP